MPRKAKSVAIEKPSKVVKKLPLSETGPGVHYIAKSRKEYCISQSLEKMRFTLWRIVPGGYEKMATSDNPCNLYQLAEDDK